jgi:hypothetical protein
VSARRRGVAALAAGAGLLAAPLASDGAALPRPDPVAVERVGWLAGCWEGTMASGAVYEEVWLPPRGGTLAGVARMTRGGRTFSIESMTIVDDDGTLVYLARPAGQAETPFRAVEVSSTAAVFENPDHDFPQRIVYRHTSPDSLHARIEGVRGGEPRSLDFPLARVHCPG